MGKMCKSLPSPPAFSLVRNNDGHIVMEGMTPDSPTTADSSPLKQSVAIITAPLKGGCAD